MSRVVDRAGTWIGWALFGDLAKAFMLTFGYMFSKPVTMQYPDKEKWVPLKTHIPVHLMYFTLRVDDDGTIRSYGDVYGHNKKLIDLMNA